MYLNATQASYLKINMKNLTYDNLQKKKIKSQFKVFHVDVQRSQK